MTLDTLYILSKKIKDVPNFYSKNMELIYFLDKQTHESLQKECYKKTRGTINGYQSQNLFEISLFDIKFIFKLNS
jgi:hypothetical protein